MLIHYPEPGGRESQIWSVAQDADNVMLFANRRGILSYNGYDWKNIRVPFIPIVLRTHPVTSRVYVAGNNNFGYLEKDRTGAYSYRSVLEASLHPSVFTRIIVTDSSLFVYGLDAIYELSNSNYNQDNILLPPEGEHFTGIFKGPSKIYVNVSGSGLHRIEADTLFPIVTGYLTAEKEVLFSLPYNRNLVLLGLNDSRLYLFDGIKFYDFDAGDDGYLAGSILSEGLVINDSLYAFSTLNGGALIYSRELKSPIFLLNYQNGLPDDEIFSIGTDNFGGLWMSHTFGLTRADITIPVRNFGIYPGLKGNINTTLLHGGKLYVSTSEGVFYMKEIRDYKESYVRVEVSRQSREMDQTPEIVSTKADFSQQEAGEKRSRQTIFNKLFGKKVSPESEAAEKQSAEQPEKKDESSGKGSSAKRRVVQPQFESRKVTTLMGIRYLFEKVKDLDEKARNLIPSPEGILVATNGGLYCIENGAALQIIKDSYINDIIASSTPDKYYAATNSGYKTITYNNGWIVEEPVAKVNMPVYSILEAKGYLWLGSDDVALRISNRNNYLMVDTFNVETDFPQRYFIGQSGDTIFLLMESGAFYLKPGLPDIYPYLPELYNIDNGFSFILSRAKNPWFKSKAGYRFGGDVEGLDRMTSLLGLSGDLNSIRVEGNNLWVVDSQNRLLRIGGQTSDNSSEGPKLHFAGIADESGQLFELFDTYFDQGDGAVYIRAVAPYYSFQSGMQYQYIIENQMDEWSKWSNDPEVALLLSPGSYNISIRAKDFYGRIGEPRIQRVTIKPPFTRSIPFYVIIAVATITGLWGFIRLREGKLLHDKRILEQKVKERTAEIESQKEEITSSIEYARRIQEAMLPAQNILNKTFPDHFVLFKPRDIVSGDFYWLAEDNKRTYLAVSDCTGHGVPGAFMSLLGISALNEIINDAKCIEAGDILTLLREKIKRSLNQTGKPGEAADGMDMTMCIFNSTRNQLEYSGAYNSLYIVRNGKLTEFKADRMPIGIFHGEELPFTSYVVKLVKGDLVYLLSDGFADQFGENNKGKFKKARIKSLILEVSSLPLKEQKLKLESSFEIWKGSLGQIDDVTIMCVKV